MAVYHLHRLPQIQHNYRHTNEKYSNTKASAWFGGPRGNPLEIYYGDGPFKQRYRLSKQTVLHLCDILKNSLATALYIYAKI